jgi:hypothetical protein
MVNYAEAVVLNSFVVHFVKLVWLVRKATEALPVESVAESSRGRYMAGSATLETSMRMGRPPIRLFCPL